MSNFKKNQGADNYKSGLWAEFLACTALRLKLYRILEKRYRTKGGEIDLIAKRGNNLVFVEVKNRSKMDFGIVSYSQQKRICDAGKQFLARNDKYNGYNIRFDLIFVGSWANIKHIQNAWYGE